MRFSYEEVGEENRELWEEIGYRDWDKNLINFSKWRRWVADRENKIFLCEIGSYRFGEGPIYWDLSYKGIIIRMEIGIRYVLPQKEPQYYVYKIEMPKSIENKKEEIMQIIFEAVKCLDSQGEKYTPNIEVECRPIIVEQDYNGR